jgi:hypothetical protein
VSLGADVGTEFESSRDLETFCFERGGNAPTHRDTMAGRAVGSSDLSLRSVSTGKAGCSHDPRGPAGSSDTVHHEGFGIVIELS